MTSGGNYTPLCLDLLNRGCGPALAVDGLARVPNWPTVAILSSLLDGVEELGQLLKRYVPPPATRFCLKNHAADAVVGPATDCLVMHGLPSPKIPADHFGRFSEGQNYFARDHES
jgi:hypothetical protein